MLKDKPINELFEYSWKPHEYLPGSWIFHEGACSLCNQRINAKIHSQNAPCVNEGLNYDMGSKLHAD